MNIHLSHSHPNRSEISQSTFISPITHPNRYSFAETARSSPLIDSHYYAPNESQLSDRRPPLHHQMICHRRSYLLTQLLFASLQPRKIVILT
ncbi:hypothetical protein HanXRQr2_Chr10g0445541 [Helianthus annuus]|uniref:Uncharacterized protein n=1 Tax=Helianthus annuus TaxID=4232 RepID=A0A251THR6_HELAN|nr:hypothetical protein HanXRQr2_Chr10g0445541 [Helianthus annuus]